LTHVELIPVDDGFLSGLVNVHHIASLIDLSLTGRNVAPLRQLIGYWGVLCLRHASTQPTYTCGQGDHRSQSPSMSLNRTTELARTFGELSNGLPNTQYAIEDDAIDVIHDAPPSRNAVKPKVKIRYD
jgi:hypothetical protein